MVRHGGIRALVTIGLALAVTTACAATETTCTLIGSASGIGVDLAPAIAAKVVAGELTLCWEGACETDQLDLAPSTTAGDSTCEGEVCSARAQETGGEHAFVTVPDLPGTRVEATLRLTDRSGTTAVEHTLDVTAEPTYPNGPDCGAGGLQQQLQVDATGAVHVR